MRMRLLAPIAVLLVAIAAAAILSWKSGSSESNAELIVTNCRIWTADKELPWAASLAVKKGRILRIGSPHYVQEVAGPKTKLLDLGGKFVTPGFIDSHVHLIPGGLQMKRLDLRHVKSRAQFEQEVQTAALALQDEDAWLLGAGWNNENWGGEWPDSTWIDSVAGNHPVWLSRVDGHMGLANKVALGKCHLLGNDSKEDPVGGSIVRDESGVASGLFVDSAMLLISSCIPEPSLEERRAAFVRAGQHAVSMGVTSVVDFGAYVPGGSTEQIWRDFYEVYIWADSLGHMFIRSALFFPLESWDRVAGLIRERGQALSNWIRVCGVKAFADGSLGSSSALFHEPYADDPSNRGLRVSNLDWLSNAILAASMSNLQVAVHAIGDAANDDLLSIYSDIISKSPHKNYRFRIEHAQHLSPGAHVRFAESSIIASMQPEHLLDDASYAGKKLGQERSLRSYNFRSLLRNGTLLALGSDWPVAALDPLGGLQAAVRRTPQGWKHPWIPEESIDIAEALLGYTISAAYAAGIDDLAGSLSAGKMADFVVLSESPFEDGALPRVLSTFVGGLQAYSSLESDVPYFRASTADNI